MCIIRKIKEKRQEEKRKHLEYCLDCLGLTLDELIPMDDSEFDSFLSDLKEKVNAAPPEQDKIYGPMPGYCLPNIFAWTEIVDSLENREREAYRLTADKVCTKCGKNNLALIRFRSNDKSWEQLCGRDGYMIICPDCLKKLSFKYFIMN